MEKDNRRFYGTISAISSTGHEYSSKPSIRQEGHSTSVVRLSPRQAADDEPVLTTYTFFEGRGDGIELYSENEK